jgi:hypothetical protein
MVVPMFVGSKRDLWPTVMPRFRAEIRCNEGRSYLNTATNSVSLAQNVCYRLHDTAEMIVTVDEETFLLPDTVETPLNEYRDIKQEGAMLPGFLAPIIPLDGFRDRYPLTVSGLVAECEARSGRACICTAGAAILSNGGAAWSTRERTTPLTKTVAIPRRPRSSQISSGAAARTIQRVTE